MSCQNISSTDRCRAVAITGIQFCGKHVKVKNPRIWTEVNNVIPKVILIQKIWRGFNIRNRISDCGPGVLKRSLCHNDEEMITMESKDRQYPLNYFSFEEGGKVFWFEVDSIAKCVFDKMGSMNPYTRQPITLETRRRLRRVCFRLKLPRPTNVSKIWIHVCQILEENGFEEMNPMIFESLNKTQFYVFLSLLKTDLEAISAETPNHKARLLSLVAIRHLMNKHTPFIDQLDACRKVAIFLYNIFQFHHIYH